MNSVLVVVATLVAGASTRPNEAKDFSSPAQIQAHLFQTALDLAEQTPAGLEPELLNRRQFLLQRLERYASVGRFPHNHVVPGQNPIFIDPHGTACAVGQLIIDSGHRALAERISAQQNRSYLLEMTADPELAAWIARSGFTAAALARIQPGYTYFAWEFAVVVEVENGAATPRKTKFEEQASLNYVRSTQGAVEADGATWYISGYDSKLYRDADGIAGTETAGNGQVYGLQVVGGSLYAMTVDGLYRRGPGTNWSLVTRASGSQFWVNSPTDVWAFAKGEVKHFDGVDVITEQLPNAGISGDNIYAASIWADLTGQAWVAMRYYSTEWGVKLFQRSLTGWVERNHDLGDGTVFGGAGQAWFLTAQGRLFGLGAGDPAEENTGTSKPMAAGVVFSNGSIVLAGMDGAIFERTAQGVWRDVSIASKVDFASVTESASGTAILGVASGGCEGADSVCPQAPPTTNGGGFICSAADGLVPWALVLLALTLVRPRGLLIPARRGQGRARGRRRG